jgi:hypothetical protein
MVKELSIGLLTSKMSDHHCMEHNLLLSCPPLPFRHLGGFLAWGVALHHGLDPAKVQEE